MPKTQIKVGSYQIERESKHIKISHENKSFVLHMGATDSDAQGFFDQVKMEDGKKYFELIFSCIQVFDTLAIQNPEYMQKWLSWHNGYFDELKKELTPEEDQQVIDEEKALYEMGNEPNKIEENE